MTDELQRLRAQLSSLQSLLTLSNLMGDSGDQLRIAQLAGTAVPSLAREADRANTAKSEFLFRMSHELRTLLNAILGFGQLLEIDDLTEEQADGVDHILRAGRHLLGLINEVLDLARIESGHLALSPEAVDVHEVIKDTVDLIGPLAAERALRILAPSPSECPWTVQADRQRLKQILLNLASNAVKYNNHGGSISLTCAALDGRLRIAVADTGPGIPAGKLPRLFTQFDRLGAEHSEVQGTGMGLVLAKRLAEAMDGALTVASVEGEGTTFTLELSLAMEPA